MESDGHLRPAHRHRLGRPPPQGLEARAALERDDRPAVSERVPHRLPVTRGNRTPRTRQAGGDELHIMRTVTIAAPKCGSPVTSPHLCRLHTLPRRIQGRCNQQRAKRVWDGAVGAVSPVSRGFTLRASVHAPLPANMRQSATASPMIVRRKLLPCARRHGMLTGTQCERQSGRGEPCQDRQRPSASKSPSATRTWRARIRPSNEARGNTRGWIT